MLDYRLNTFLLLCEELNYTETAKKLHITQPNVSQHIRYLEDFYGVKFFVYKNRELFITPEGEKFRQMVKRLSSESKKIIHEMSNFDNMKLNLNFGTSLTIGEYIMPDIIKKIDFDKYSINMIVENTESLLNKLEDGELDFVIIEGQFDKAKYDSYLFSKENFIGIGSPDFDGKYSLRDLLDNRLILREKGSGTREIFERVLFDYNLGVSSFSDIIEIGNMNAIKKLVADGMGISFLYEKAGMDYIERGLVRKLDLDFAVEREFNFVMLKDSNYKGDYLDIYDMFVKYAGDMIK